MVRRKPLASGGESRPTPKGADLKMMTRLLDRIKNWKKSLALSQATNNFWNFITARSTSTSGTVVDAHTAMNLSAVYACVRVLSETIGSLPLIIYKNTKTGKDRATNHPLYRVLHDAPNPEMTSMQWRETVMAHLSLQGNHFSEIIFQDTKVKELWPIPPDLVEIKRDQNNKLVYKVNIGGGKVLNKEKVLHIRGLSLDGIVGVSPITYARETIGLGLAAQEYASRFFSGDANPNGVYSHPTQLGDVAYKRLQEALKDGRQGLSRQHRNVILEEGMKWERVSLSPEDAQLLESRKFGVEEIARIYRIPLHKINSMEKATFSNIEQQAIEFVTDTIRPWLVRIEQEITMKLIGEADRDNIFAEFLVEGLLRGDTKSRYEAYNIARNGGWMSANDIRRLENMNDIENGDTYLVPLNMTPAKQGGSNA